MTETELLAEVVKLCDRHQVKVFHSTDSRRDVGKGFPDLVIAGRDHILFAELKSMSGTFKPEQTQWRYRIIAAGGNWVCWTPRDLESGTVEKAIQSLDWQW